MTQPTTPPGPPTFTDPKSAKAQAKADKAYAKASRPWFKKKRFIGLGVIAVLVIIIIAANSGGSSSSNTSATGASASSGGSSAAAKAAGLNTPVRDGKFQFTVTGMDCSKTSLGPEGIVKANGVFCIVNLTVENIGTEAQTLDATSQDGYDAQNRKFSTDTGAEAMLPNNGGSLFNQLNPGSSVTGQIVYDVPAGTQLTHLELHDSAFSGGVTVNLH